MGKISKKKEGMRELALTQKHLEINLTTEHIIKCGLVNLSS